VNPKSQWPFTFRNLERWNVVKQSLKIFFDLLISVLSVEDKGLPSW